jgi:hypothetical protein
MSVRSLVTSILPSLVVYKSQILSYVRFICACNVGETYKLV